MKFTVEVADPRGVLAPEIVLAEIRDALSDAAGDHEVFVETATSEFLARVRLTITADLKIDAVTEADAHTIALAYLGNLETSADMVRDMDLGDYGGCDELQSADNWSCVAKPHNVDPAEVVRVERVG